VPDLVPNKRGGRRSIVKNGRISRSRMVSASLTLTTSEIKALMEVTEEEPLARVIVKRTLTVLFMLCILGGGLATRLLVTVPTDGVIDYDTDNMTDTMNYSSTALPDLDTNTWRHTSATSHPVEKTSLWEQGLLTASAMPEVESRDTHDVEYMTSDEVETDLVHAKAINAQGTDAPTIDAIATDALATDALTIDAHAIDTPRLDAQTIDADVKLDEVLKVADKTDGQNQVGADAGVVDLAETNIGFNITLDQESEAEKQENSDSSVKYAFEKLMIDGSSNNYYVLKVLESDNIPANDIIQQRFTQTDNMEQDEKEVNANENDAIDSTSSSQTPQTPNSGEVDADGVVTNSFHLVDRLKSLLLSEKRR